uniref:Cleavage and polyadenylation specificity factor subunit 1 n=1 Tax=Varanus komodoensis TaxID=61221 RepID=A0A8D2Q7Y8_VARKO
MYAVYKQAHPPTGLEFSMYCNFFSNAERNLVVAGTSQLYVYRLNHDSEGKGHKEKLELVAAFSFFGNVMSMASVQLAGAKRDALLLSFKDAKLSVVEYDPGTHDLKTLSLHYFEEPELRGCCQRVLRLDPSLRAFLSSWAGSLCPVAQLLLSPSPQRCSRPTGPLLPRCSQKSSFLPSYIIDVRELDEKLLNIIDMQFLCGYYEPTLLILFEPNQTWPGRVAVRQDTCSIVAISLNIMQKVHPVIWSLSNLPFDCTQALAVPKPIGGVVIFAVNSLLYLNQSVPPYGVSLNSLTNGTTVFPLRVQEGVKMTLDCAQATFISYDKMVISLKGGEIYVLTLITDGMRSVRSFHFDKAAASVLTTCMITMDPGYLFLGSRLGNSLLLKYTEKLQEPPMSLAKDAAEKDEPPVKKKRVEQPANWAGGKSAPQDEVDEIEVYGSEAQSGTQLATYSFEVCDSILNIGPCANAAMGEPAFLSEEFQNSPEPDLEIVVCSGYGKNGALSVLQKSIRPQVVTTFELPGCYDMWTVISPQKTEEEEDASGESTEKEPPPPEPADDGKRHGFLILSREDSTMILQTGQEIMELDTSGFATQGPTVYSGNIGENRYIVQVSPLGIRLLEGVNQLHFIPVDLGSPIVHCAVADPYVVIMSAEGQVTMFVLKSDSYGGRTHRLTLQKPQLHHQPKVIALCVYRDVSGMFTTESHPSTSREELSARSQSEAELGLGGNTVDDEEEMLYGDSGSLFSPSKEEPRRSSLPSADRDPHQYKAEPTHWCVLVRENGTMEIYQLPEWRLVFLVKNFPMGQRVLVDSSFGQPASQGEAKKEEVIRQTEMPLVKEVLLVALGNRQSRPYLLVSSDAEAGLCLVHRRPPHVAGLLIALSPLPPPHEVPHNINFREKKPRLSKKKPESVSGEESAAPRGRVARFRFFEDIYGYSGVFICGPSPHWLLVTSRGALRLHPMTIDGPIESFAPFHNVNCPKGFLYFNRQGELRISVLPAYLSYDAPWPVRKIPLRCTAHYVAYHVESKVYAVATSINNPCTRIPRMTGEEKEFETIERDDRYMHPLQEAFSIQLISPVSWETIPNTRIDLEEWEHVTCMKTVSLKSEETVSGLKGYIAVGTCLMQGEEVTCRGRVLITDIIEVVPEPGQPLTKNKFKVLYEKEQKGPVTALCHCNGYLVSAIGQKIFLWSLKDNDLTGMAFIDTQLYIHQMISVKNFILAADVMKSISLLRYQEESKTLSLVSRDAKPLEVYSVDFMVDSAQLGFLVSDRDRNLLVYMYLPEAKESFGGMRLLRRADFHVGAHVNAFWRTPCRGATEGLTKKAIAWENKHITWFATLDGGIGLLLPMQEKTYRRLLMLQNALTTMLPHHAGLNPRAFRMLHMDRRILQNAVRNILDGELLNRYLYLSTMERSELAKKIGTTPDIVSGPGGLGSLPPLWLGWLGGRCRTPEPSGGQLRTRGGGSLLAGPCCLQKGAGSPPGRPLFHLLPPLAVRSTPSLHSASQSGLFSLPCRSWKIYWRLIVSRLISSFPGERAPPSSGSPSPPPHMHSASGWAAQLIYCIFLKNKQERISKKRGTRKGSCRVVELQGGA